MLYILETVFIKPEISGSYLKNAPQAFKLSVMLMAHNFKHVYICSKISGLSLKIPKFRDCIKIYFKYDIGVKNTRNAVDLYFWILRTYS